MVTKGALEAMRAMALDPKKKLILAKDSTCIGGLVIVLSNSDSCIVKDALQILLLLCENPEAKTVLKSQVGMIDQLETLLARNDKDFELNCLAKQLHFKLDEVCDPPTKTPLKDFSNISRNNSHYGKGTTKSIVLQLRGFQDKSDRDLCARLLLKINGVISITFDLAKKRCILRTKFDVKPEVLAATIAKSMTMTALQVVRNEKGEESLRSFNLSGHSDGFENEVLPDYLSDDSDVTMLEEKAVKKITEEDRKKSSTWFSAAANFLTNSFYW